MDPFLSIFLIFGGIAVAIYLITRRWFWWLLFFTAGLAACFAMIASIIHFQILAAVGLFFVMMICWGIANGILSGWTI